jgi:hypothetical protein
MGFLREEQSDYNPDFMFVGIARKNESYCANKVQPFTELAA